MKLRKFKEQEESKTEKHPDFELNKKMASSLYNRWKPLLKGRRLHLNGLSESMYLYDDLIEICWDSGSLEAYRIDVIPCHFNQSNMEFKILVNGALKRAKIMY